MCMQKAAAVGPPRTGASNRRESITCPVGAASMSECNAPRFAQVTSTISHASGHHGVRATELFMTNPVRQPQHVIEPSASQLAPKRSTLIRQSRYQASRGSMNFALKQILQHGGQPRRSSKTTKWPVGPQRAAGRAPCRAVPAYKALRHEGEEGLRAAPRTRCLQ